jgi:hypothetical protein
VRADVADFIAVREERIGSLPTSVTVGISIA